MRLSTSGDVCALTDLSARVAEIVGRAPFDADAAESIVVVVNRDWKGLLADVTFDHGNGNSRGPRRVRATNCDELIDAVALIVAMGLPRDREEHTQPSTRASTDTPTAERTLSLEASPSIASRISQPTGVRSALRSDVIVGGAGLATGKELGGELVLGGRVRRGRTSLAAEASVQAPREINVAAQGRVDILRVELSLSPCEHLGAWSACVLASLGTIRGSGNGLSGATSVLTPLAAGGVRGAWEVGVSDGVVVRLHVGLNVLATKTVFDVDHMPVWSSQRVEGVLGIGILKRIP